MLMRASVPGRIGTVLAVLVLAVLIDILYRKFSGSMSDSAATQQKVNRLLFELFAAAFVKPDEEPTEEQAAVRRIRRRQPN